MSAEEVKVYKRTSDFRRNEALWILHKLDKKPPHELAMIFALSQEDVKEVIRKHQRYWDATI